MLTTAKFCENGTCVFILFPSPLNNIFHFVDGLRTGKYRSLYHPDQIISSKEDASNCYARGYYTLGKNIIEDTMEQLRKQVEACECIQSFFVFHSFGGGTGSGFTSLLLDHIATEFTSKSRLALAIYPSPNVSTDLIYSRCPTDK